MSKNLTGSATIQATNADINSLTYKGSNVSDSLPSELVHRTSLHPTYVNGKLEKRVHYSLHNDASDCVSVSPIMKMEIYNGEIKDTVPNSPLDFEEPPYQIVPQDASFVEPDTDKNIVIPGGGPSYPSVNNGATNFDNYADLLFTTSVVTHQPMRWKPKNVESRSEVTQFYENYSLMETAKYAMASTRSIENKKGRKIKDFYGRLLNGFGMYNKSNIMTVELTTPVMTEGSSMFEAAPHLTSIHLDAHHLMTAIAMCKGCISLTEFVLTEEVYPIEDTFYPLTDISYMFQGCRKLQSVTFQTTSNIQHIDHTFDGCNHPHVVSMEKEENNLPAFRNVQTATYTFANSGWETLSYYFPNAVDCSHMMENAKRLKKIGDNSNLSKMTTAEYMCSGCKSLVADYINEYPKLTNARGMYSGCYSLKTIHPKYTVLEEGSELFKDCKLLTKVNFKGKFPALKNANEMFRGCKKLDKVESTFDNLVQANMMFYDCKGIHKIDITAPKLVEGQFMLNGTKPTGTVKLDAPLLDSMDYFLQNAISTGFKFEGKINPISTNYAFKKSSITSFKNTNDFSRLLYAEGMFAQCYKLNKVEFGTAPQLVHIDSLVQNCYNLTYFSGSFPAVVMYTLSPFSGCSRLKEVNLNFSSLTTAHNMFRDMPELVSVTGNFSKVTDATNMFRNCPKLQVSPSTPVATICLGMYQGTPITELPRIPNLENGRQAFMNCKELKGHINVERYGYLQNGVNMFNNCDGITSVDIYMPNTVDVRNMFANCKNITSIGQVRFGDGVEATSLMPHSKVDYDSLMRVYNALQICNPKADGNHCVCHVGVKPSVLGLIRNNFNEEMFYHWEDNQYALRLNSETNDFLMVIPNA